MENVGKKAKLITFIERGNNRIPNKSAVLCDTERGNERNRY